MIHGRWTDRQTDILGKNRGKHEKKTYTPQGKLNTANNPTEAVYDKIQQKANNTRLMPNRATQQCPEMKTQ